VALDAPRLAGYSSGVGMGPSGTTSSWRIRFADPAEAEVGSQCLGSAPVLAACVALTLVGADDPGLGDAFLIRCQRTAANAANHTHDSKQCCQAGC